MIDRGGVRSIHRRSLTRDVDDPANWLVARPSPGAPSGTNSDPPFAAAGESLSVYSVRHEPSRPGADDARDSILLRVPETRYAYVRFLVTGGSGRSELPVTLVFADGTETRAKVTAPDWYDAPSPDRAPPAAHRDALPLLSGLDRIRRGRFKDHDRPTLFEATVPASGTVELTAIRLEVSGARYEDSRSRFHLVAVTAVEVD